MGCKQITQQHATIFGLFYFAPKGLQLLFPHLTLLLVALSCPVTLH